jgi:hypothetical protein
MHHEPIHVASGKAAPGAAHVATLGFARTIDSGAAGW